MELVKTYEEYSNLNKEYVKFVEIVMSSEISQFDEVIMHKLEEYSTLFEELKIKCDGIKVQEQDLDNLKDLNYLSLDTLFLSLDLKNFYSLQQPERFKMRAVNYINRSLSAKGR